MDFPIYARLFEHMWWADALVFEVLERSDGVPARALEIYAHVLGAELIWLDRIEGVQQSVAVWPEASIDTCRRLAKQARDRYKGFLGRLTPSEIRRGARYTNSAGLEFETPVGEILIHVALHGSYHRGQLALLQRDTDAVPNPTDYIAFVRGVPAATRQTPPRA